MMKIPSIILPIIRKDKTSNERLTDVFENKKIVIFGVPGAFTPTCSEKHFPGFLKLKNKIIQKGISDIYCISVNDIFVIRAWLKTYSDGNKIAGIADGNADFAKTMNLVKDYSKNFMGYRCKRFSLIADNNSILH